MLPRFRPEQLLKRPEGPCLWDMQEALYVRRFGVPPCESLRSANAFESRITWRVESASTSRPRFRLFRGDGDNLVDETDRALDFAGDYEYMSWHGKRFGAMVNASESLVLFLSSGEARFTKQT